MTDYTPFTIYGRTLPFCTYCEQAKQLLASKNMPFVFIDIGKDITKEEFLEIMPDARTVPQIFEGDMLIGGFAALKSYLELAESQ